MDTIQTRRQLLWLQARLNLLCQQRRQELLHLLPRVRLVGLDLRKRGATRIWHDWEWVLHVSDLDKLREQSQHHRQRKWEASAPRVGLWKVRILISFCFAALLTIHRRGPKIRPRKVRHTERNLLRRILWPWDARSCCSW